MISLLREYANLWIIKVLLGIIILVFVFLGVNSIDSSKTGKVATVDKEPITIQKFLEVYNNAVNQIRKNKV